MPGREAAEVLQERVSAGGRVPRRRLPAGPAGSVVRSLRAAYANRNFCIY